MTKETISTFLPIVNIWIRAKSVKSKASNPRNKTPENQRSFPAANPIPRNWQPAKLHVNHLRCLTFGSPFSSMCRVSTVTPTVFSYNWVAFLKSSSSFDFEQWKKRSQRKTEIVIDGRSICHSWQCFQLAFLVTWKLTFSAQSEQVSTNVPFF